jgi:hypothetical protein
MTHQDKTHVLRLRDPGSLLGESQVVGVASGVPSAGVVADNIDLGLTRKHRQTAKAEYMKQSHGENVASRGGPYDHR